MREQTRQLSAAVDVFRLAGSDGPAGLGVATARASVQSPLLARPRPARTIQKAMQ
jgi:hypothetical protein